MKKTPWMAHFFRATVIAQWIRLRLPLRPRVRIPSSFLELEFTLYLSLDSEKTKEAAIGPKKLQFVSMREG